jgi:hypothetical protein
VFGGEAAKHILFISAFSPPGEETRKMGVLGGGAAQYTHFSGILPFPLQVEGAGGWRCPLLSFSGGECRKFVHFDEIPAGITG